MPGSFYPIWVIDDKNKAEKKEVFIHKPPLGESENKKKETIYKKTINAYLQECIKQQEHQKCYTEIQKCYIECMYLKSILLDE